MLIYYIVEVEEYRGHGIQDKYYLGKVPRYVSEQCLLFPATNPATYLLTWFQLVQEQYQIGRPVDVYVLLSSCPCFHLYFELRFAALSIAIEPCSLAPR